MVIQSLCLLIMLGGSSMNAQLPTFKGQPWLGYFAVHLQRDYQFRLDSEGEGTVVPLQKSGEPITKLLHLPVKIFIEEKLPDGKIVARALQVDSLASASPATERFDKLTFTGKTAGDAAFEVTLEAQGARVRYGGRITDKGTLTTNPIQLCVQVRFPIAYRPIDLDKKDIIKEVKDAELKVTRLDGKRFKLPADKPLAEPPNEVANKDLNLVDVEIGAWRGTEFEFSATPHSAIRLETPDSEGLLRGFFVKWYPDAATDPKGESRFQIEVK